MEGLIYNVFICIVVPMLMMLILLNKNARPLVGFMIIGMFISLFTSEINSIILAAFNNDKIYVTTVFTPMIEEVSKAIPILFYAYVFYDGERDKLMQLALVTGIGFALFENTVLIVQNVDSVTLGWSLARGFSTALMHGVCTMLVAFGLSFIKDRKKLAYCGTFAILMFVIIYHGIFNALVQSDYKYVGIALPVVTYAPFIIRQIIFYVRRKKAGKPVDGKKAVKTDE